jgi:hypothetical protein
MAGKRAFAQARSLNSKLICFPNTEYHNGSVGMSNVIAQLQECAAPEFNFLLTERPSRMANGFIDFGWYCREHAFCTLVVSALLGVACQAVRGDFIINTFDGFKLSSIGTDLDHAWCRSSTAPILDLSLNFKHFGQGPQLVKPIIQLGRNGIFDVRLLPDTTAVTTDFGQESVIGYIPRTVFHWTAFDLISNPLMLIATEEAAAISARVALHAFHVLRGTQHSFIGLKSQSESLVYLRRTFPDALLQLRQLLKQNQAPYIPK